MELSLYLKGAAEIRRQTIGCDLASRRALLRPVREALQNTGLHEMR